MGYRLKIAGKTDKGRKRSKNEDAFLVDPDIGFMLVADGMGGHAAGEVASNLASTLCLEQLKRALQTGHVPVSSHVPPNPHLDKRSLLLGDCVKFSNMAVYEAANSNPETKNMGTTLVAALSFDNRLAVANVGDSRLYIMRNDELVQCTIDHSFVQEQVDRGLLKPEDAEKSDFRNMLTRSIGVSADVDVDLKEVELMNGDYVLLCSDGLTKMLDQDQIEAVFKEEKDPQTIADQLVERANKAGGGDNITVIVAHVDNGSLTNRVKDIFKKGITKS
jgi:PPM family protein phosphatase